MLPFMPGQLGGMQQDAEAVEGGLEEAENAVGDLNSSCVTTPSVGQNGGLGHIVMHCCSKQW